MSDGATIQLTEKRLFELLEMAVEHGVNKALNRVGKKGKEPRLKAKQILERFPAISKSTLYNACASGKIGIRKPGSKLYYLTETEVQNYFFPNEGK